MSRTLARLLVAGLVLAAGSTVFTQTPPSLTFEVASINPVPPITAAQIQSGNARMGMTVNDARVDIGYMSVANLLPIAFAVKPYQIAGLAPGVNDQRFDIRATLPKGATREQVPEMLRAMLTERFGLVVHREKREMPVYGLTVGKDGPKLREAAPEVVEAPKEPGPGDVVIGSGDSQIRLSRAASGTAMTVSSPQTGRMLISMGENGALRMTIARVTMPGLAEMLTSLAGRPVLDMTGLGGTYEVDLEIATADLLNLARSSGLASTLGPLGGLSASAPGDAASDPGSGSIFKAVQSLGLKLDSQKSPIEVVVVDRVEKNPTAN